MTEQDHCYTIVRAAEAVADAVEEVDGLSPAVKLINGVLVPEFGDFPAGMPLADAERAMISAIICSRPEGHATLIWRIRPHIVLDDTAGVYIRCRFFWRDDHGATYPVQVFLTDAERDALNPGSIFLGIADAMDVLANARTASSVN